MWAPTCSLATWPFPTDATAVAALRTWWRRKSWEDGTSESTKCVAACKERGRVARTHGPVRGVAPAAKRMKKWSPATQGRTSAFFAVSYTCVEFEQVKCELCESCRDWASSLLFIALRSCLESGSAVFTRQSTELSTIQSFMQLYGYTVWWLSSVWTLFTLSLCVKGDMLVHQWYWDHGMGLGAFLIFWTLLFFFRSLALVFQKSPTRNKEATRFTLIGQNVGRNIEIHYEEKIHSVTFGMTSKQTTLVQPFMQDRASFSLLWPQNTPMTNSVIKRSRWKITWHFPRCQKV